MSKEEVIAKLRQYGFKKGKSGNPYGRRRINYELRDAARSYTMEALGVLVTVMRDQENPVLRLKAADMLLERGWGKPIQPVEVNKETAPVEFTILIDSKTIPGEAEA